MKPAWKPSPALIAIGKALGPLAEEVVFTGGAALSLYLAPGSEEPRFTDDVDAIISATTTAEFHGFEARLKAKGFRPSRQKGAPICRYEWSGFQADFMPLDSAALGFTNSWFKEGYKLAQIRELEPGLRVKCLDTSHFLASKAEAWNSRGGPDPRLSHDFEDLVAVLDAQENLESISGMLPAIREYLAKVLGNLDKRGILEEALSAHLEHQQIVPGRVSRILDWVRGIDLE